MLCASNTYTRTMFPVIFKWISTNVFTSNIYMHVLQQPERILDNTNTMHFPSPSNLHVHSFTLVYNSDGIPVVAWTVLQDQPHIRALTRNHTIYIHMHTQRSIPYSQPFPQGLMNLSVIQKIRPTYMLNLSLRSVALFSISECVFSNFHETISTLT